MIGEMSRRDRTLLAIGVGVVLYGIAAYLWFGGVSSNKARPWWRPAMWDGSIRSYERAVKSLAGEKKLISRKEEWRERAEGESEKMPVAGMDESTQVRWQRALEKIASDHYIRLVSEQPKDEEEHGGVWEMPIELKYEAALGKLVEFLYALEHSREAMFDVRDIDITAKNNGVLAGKMTLTCAYMKTDAPKEGAKRK